MTFGNKLTRAERLAKQSEIRLGLRTCSICLIQKPLSNFYSKLDKPFFMSACKLCMINKQKEKRRLAKPDLSTRILGRHNHKPILSLGKQTQNDTRSA